MRSRYVKHPELKKYPDIPVSGQNDPQAYNRWYKRLARSGKSVEYWIEYDKRIGQ